MTTTIIYPQGNKREVPPDVPTGRWLNDMREIVDLPELADIPWVHPVMEYLDPALLRRFRAQALVWRSYTGEWPEEVAYWWPVRLGRRYGQVPHMGEVVESHIDSGGVLHCGFCKARWSAKHDGSPHLDRCKLCDRLWLVILDAREVETWPK